MNAQPGKLIPRHGSTQMHWHHRGKLPGGMTVRAPRLHTLLTLALNASVANDPDRLSSTKLFCVARSLFDHLVGAQQYRCGYRKAKRLGGLEVYDRLVLGRKLHREIARLRAA